MLDVSPAACFNGKTLQGTIHLLGKQHRYSAIIYLRAIFFAQARGIYISLAMEPFLGLVRAEEKTISYSYRRLACDDYSDSCTLP